MWIRRVAGLAKRGRWSSCMVGQNHIYPVFFTWSSSNIWSRITYGVYLRFWSALSSWHRAAAMDFFAKCAWAWVEPCWLMRSNKQDCCGEKVSWTFEWHFRCTQPCILHVFHTLLPMTRVGQNRIYSPYMTDFPAKWEITNCYTPYTVV